MNWAIFLTVIGACLMIFFVWITCSWSQIIANSTTTWVLIGFIGALLFAIGTALL